MIDLGIYSKFIVDTIYGANTNIEAWIYRLVRVNNIKYEPERRELVIWGNSKFISAMEKAIDDEVMRLVGHYPLTPDECEWRVPTKDDELRLPIMGYTEEDYNKWENLTDEELKAKLKDNNKKD